MKRFKDFLNEDWRTPDDLPKKSSVSERDYCDHCGAPDSEYRINPYLEDAEDEIEWQHICDTCYDELLDEC